MNRRAAAILHPYISLLAPEVRRELSVVTPETLGTNYLLHISKATDLGRFVPGVSRRSMKREDRSVARVATAPSLMGCLLGYASDLFDFHERKPGARFNAGNNVPFKGGYAIYGFAFDVALRPSKRLVPDVEQTDEHWLVPYDSQHSFYVPVQLGRVFYASVNYDFFEGRPSNTIEMFIEVSTDVPIWLEGRQKLTRGFWRVKVRNLHESVRWDQLRDLEVERVQEGVYTSVKRNVASMLSLEQYAPATASW